MKKITDLRLISLILILLFLLLKPTDANANLTTVFSDSFTDLDNTPLTSHNNNWTTGGTDPQIENDTLQINESLQTATSISIQSTNFLNQCVSTNVLFPYLHSMVTLNVRRSLSDSLGNFSGYFTFIDDETHTFALGWYSGTSVNNWLANYPLDPYPSDGWHNYKLCAIGTHISAYLDDVLLKEADDSNVTAPGFTEIQMGPRIISSNLPNIYLDNFLYEAETPRNPDLNVPLLKQTSNPWQSEIYDNANKWSPSAKTIKSWGCALTSGAMILNYYGINKLPNGKSLDPGTLNLWLKSQKDGYLGEGWVNWLALSRLSKLAKSINGISNFDALEYNRLNTANISQLTDDINSSHPDILEEPGHFVVGKGINGATFDINDPYYNRTTLDNEYSNTFLSLGRYIPSSTDLSYIMLAVNPEVNFDVTDLNGNPVGESFIQEPLANDDNPSQINSAIRIYYLPKPNNSYYKLKIYSNETSAYILSSYFYDLGGNVEIFKNKGIVNSNNSDEYNLLFDKQNSSNSGIKQKNVNGNLLNDLYLEFSLGNIDNQGIFSSLLTKANQKNNYSSFINEINSQNGKHISPSAFDILLEDINNILNQISS